MKENMIFARISFAALLIFMPLPVFAQTFVQFAELFNIFAGLMLAAGILVFVGGLGSYFFQLGTWPSPRDHSIKVMEWGVAILFVLIIILGIVQYFQRYPTITSTILAVIIVSIIAVSFAKVMKKSGEAKKEKE